MDQALNVLDRAPEQGGSEDTVGDLGGLFGALFGIEMQQGEVDVALEVRAEPRREVCAFSCMEKQVIWG